MPLPRIPFPNPSQDALSAVTQAIRAGLQGRSQGQNILGRIPQPTYKMLRAKEIPMLTPVSFGPGGDWRIERDQLDLFEGRPQKDYKQPSDRIDRGLIIKDLVTFEEIKIQFVPQTLDYLPDSNFVAIASMGRNNPFYHFAGSEDTLKLDLDWHSYDVNREDVIANCKKLEALSKNDGYNAAPHKVKLIWNSILFSDAVWQVVAAPYKLSMFHAGVNMLPGQAYQFVTLKKVTDHNLTSEEIRKITT